MIVPPRKKSYRITEVFQKANELFFLSEAGKLRIRVISPFIFRISFTETEGFEGEKEERYTENTDFELTEDEPVYGIVTDSLRLSVCKETGSISLINKDGSRLYSERAEESRELEKFDAFKAAKDGKVEVKLISTADGVKKKTVSAEPVFDKTLFRTRTWFDFSEDEKIYGFGQMEEGTLNKRGTVLYLHQANLKIAYPVFLSDKGYGLYFTTESTAIFSDTVSGSFMKTEGDRFLDYYLIGKTDEEPLYEVMKRIRLLYGKASFMPKWVFGYIQSQERYESADEMISAVERFEEEELGIDCIVLDWESWPEGQWGEKKFDKKRFPDMKKTVDTLHAHQVRMMLSIWPNMGDMTEDHKEMAAAGLLYPGNDVYDAFDPAGQELYFQQMKNEAVPAGIDAYWCDSSEPFCPEWMHKMKPDPATMYAEYLKNAENAMGVDHANAYGLRHSEGVYRHLLEEGNRRPVILTRSGYPGSQAAGTFIWSGDTYASWETYRRQITEALNISMSGMPYWTMDIGAFFVKKGQPWYWSGEYDGTNEDPAYAELYTRWFEFGAFLPMFRAHGTDFRREPWAFDNEPLRKALQSSGLPETAFYDALRETIELRYRLLPYIYSTAREVYEREASFIRPLPVLFDDETSKKTDNEFFFGRSLLVCPVTEPLYFDKHGCLTEKEKTALVWLPEGVFYDFYTNERFEGGRYIDRPVTLSRIPLFVPEGGILALTPPVRHTEAEAEEPVEIRYYSGKAGEFMLYRDAGDGYGFEKGEFLKTVFRFEGEDSDPIVSKTGDPAFDRPFEIKIIK